MKLGIKIILPILVLLIIILATFGYLLYNLKQQEVVISAQATKIQKLNSLHQRLVRQQEQTEDNVISYRFTQDRSFLLAISQAELDKSKTLDEMSPFIITPRGRELVTNYIDSRKDIESLRNELITAIDEGNEEQVNLTYNKWSIQTQNIKGALSDIGAYNINSLETTLALVGAIGNEITRLTIIMGFVVIATTLFLYFYLRIIITTPLTKLATFADQLAKVDFTTTTTTTTTRNDELGMLSRAINNMAIKLREAYQNLEEKVKEKTEQLVGKVKTLEDARKATLNLLEDLEEEKGKLIEVGIKDEAVFSSIGDGLIVTDDKGTIVEINEAFEKLLGFSADEVIGKKMVDIVQKVDEDGKLIPPGKRSLQRVLAGEIPIGKVSTVVKTHCYIRKDKSKLPVVGVVTPMIRNNKILGAVQVFRDVTYEQSIDKAKTEFVSLASHQLRTPLTSINWYIEMLAGGDAGVLNDKQKEFFSEIYKGSRRMVTLVSDLLNVSRLETGRLKIEPVPTELTAFIQEVRKEVEPLVAETGCHVSLEFPKKKAAQLNVDRLLLRQVIDNLLTNAIRYSSVAKKGQVILSLTVSPEEYTITVKDNGIGIPKEVQSRIFEKFFRADNARKVVADGNGLGLYLVKQIMETCGGTIGFSSKGGGTTFYVTIPVTGMKAKVGEKGLEG